MNKQAIDLKERTICEIVTQFFEPIFFYKKESIRASIPAIFGGFISVYLVYLLKDISNGLQNGFNASVLPLISIFSFGVILQILVLWISRNRTYAILRPTFRKFMYRKYITEFLSLDNNETEKIGTGKLVAMMDKGMYAWTDLLNRFFMDVLSAIVIIIFSFFLIASISFFYFISVFIVFSLILYMTTTLQGVAKKYRKQRVELNIAMTRRFVKILMSKFEVLQNDKGAIECDDIDLHLNKNIATNMKVGNLNVWTDIALKFLIDGSKVLIILLVGFGLFGKYIDFGEFVSLMSVIYMLDQILTKSVNVYIDFTKIYVDVEKLWDLFDSTPKVKGYNTGKVFKHDKGDIIIQNLTYSYSHDHPVFQKFNLHILGEKVTALVGSSGSGKSTLLKLIAGYISGNIGDIIVDKQKLSEISLKTYYKDVGYLTQDPSIFDGSVFENLTYGINSELHGDKLTHIISLAKCEFIYELPQGIHTEIGERGIRLSGGQKQRLAIAKIFLKNPKIVLLDEPTSALDSFSEEMITEAMHNLFLGRTIIVIAHRLQTVKHADDIILLENGQIMERGTHKELVQLKMMYKKMLDLQSGF